MTWDITLNLIKHIEKTKPSQEHKYYYTATHPPLFNVQSQQTAGPPSVSVIGGCKQAMWNIREMIASQTIPIQQDFDLDTSCIEALT